jgi:hypothetical protein
MFIGRATPHTPYVVPPRSGAGLWTVRIFQGEDRTYPTKRDADADASVAKLNARDEEDQRPWSNFVQQLPERPSTWLRYPGAFHELILTRVEWDALARCLCVLDFFKSPLAVHVVWERVDGWLWVDTHDGNQEARVLVGAQFWGSPLPSSITRHRPKADPDAVPLW